MSERRRYAGGDGVGALEVRWEIVAAAPGVADLEKLKVDACGLGQVAGEKGLAQGCSECDA